MPVPRSTVWEELGAGEPLSDRQTPPASKAEEGPRFVSRGSTQAVTVVVGNNILDELAAYFAEDRQTERLALLVGQVEGGSNGAGFLVTVAGFLPVQAKQATPFRVAMEPQDWPVLWRKQALYLDKTFVGWAHSHPGHGIFLSATDLQTQATWFSQPWSLALVFDPVQESHGLFLGPKGERLECSIPQ